MPHSSRAARTADAAVVALRRAAASGGSGGEGTDSSRAPSLSHQSSSAIEAQPLQSTETLLAEAKAVGDEFLALEK